MKIQQTNMFEPGGHMDHQFHPDLPGHCPPDAAKAVDSEIYRGIRELPVTEEDFLSFVEEGRKCDSAKCESWGLSVWVSMNAVQHARKTVPAIRKNWFIAKGSVQKKDGKLLPTPTVYQPQHYSFWKDRRSNIYMSFTIVLQPEKRGS